MDEPEMTSLSFVVTIWLEETAEEAGQATWRGHVTHVPSGDRGYLARLDDIVTFIRPYLARLGVTAKLPWNERGR